MRQLLNFVFIYQDAHLDYCHITFRVKDVNLSARGFRDEPAQTTRYRARPTPPFYVRDFCARRISFLRPYIMSSRPRCTRQTAVRFALPDSNESNIEADGSLQYGSNFLAMLLCTLLLFHCVSRELTISLVFRHGNASLPGMVVNVSLSMAPTYLGIECRVMYMILRTKLYPSNVPSHIAVFFV